MFMSAEKKQEYLKSVEWYKLKQLKLKETDCCVVCGSSQNLELHHITYQRLGNEILTDLAIVCRSCHQTIHDKLGYSRETIYPVYQDLSKIIKELI